MSAPLPIVPTDWFALAKEIVLPDPRARELEEKTRLALPEPTNPTRGPEILRSPRG